jgi:hypothetical protein
LALLLGRADVHVVQWTAAELFVTIPRPRPHASPGFGILRQSGSAVKKTLLAVIALLVSAAALAGPCDAPEHRQFDFWIGPWVVKTPEGKEIASSRIESEYGGCVIHEHYAASGGFSGESLNVFDARRKVWHQSWVDNSGAMAQLEGTLVDGRMILEGQAVAPNGQPRTNRITWTPNADGTVRQLWETKGQDGIWKTAFDGRYHRK